MAALAVKNVSVMKSERTPFTVRLPRELHEKVADYVHENKTTMQDAAELAFTALLSPDPDETAASLRNPLRTATQEERAVLLSCLELIRSKGREERAAAAIVRKVLSTWREICRG